MDHLKYFFTILLSVNALLPSLAFDTKAVQQSSDGQPISGESPPLPSTEQIATWIANLGSESFQSRRESFVHLWRTGKPALQAIQSAMMSTDKQQAETAATLEVLIRLNVTLDDPSEAADLLSELSASPESALVKLCERGYWNVAVQLLEMNTELLETLRSSEQAYLRMNLLVDEALEQDDVTLAWPIIRKIIPFQQALWIAKRQGLEPPELDETNPSVQAWIHFIDGNHAQMQMTAAPLALKADMAVRGFQWKAFSDPEMMLGLVGTRKNVGQEAARAVMLEFAGKLDESEAIWDTIIPKVDEAIPKTKKPANTEGADDEESSKLRLYEKYITTDRRILDSLKSLEVDPGNLERTLTGMLLSGRVQIVQDYLLENSPETGWLLCLARGEQDAALSAVGIKPDFSNFEEWIAKRRDDLFAEAQKSQLSTLPLFRSTLPLANDMQMLGKSAEASRTYEVLVNVCRVARPRGNEYWFRLASEMTRSAESRFRFLNILAENYSKMEESIHDRILSILYPECVMSADVLWQTAPALKDAEGRENKWQALEQLYAYNREYFGPQDGKVLSAWLERARNKMAQSDSLSGYQLTELAKLAEGVGLSDLALKFVSETGHGGIELWVHAGRALKERGNLKSAIEYFSHIRRADSSQQESIIDEANSLLMIGRVTESVALEKSRWLRPLTIHGVRSWFSVGQRLHESSRYELAKEYLEPSFQLAACDVPDGIAMQQRNFPEIAQRFSQTADELKDVELSADLYRAILASWVSNLKPVSYAPSTYAAYGSRERSRRAILAARSNDMVAFQRHAQVAESLQPHAIDLVEDTYPDLVASGNQLLADDLLARFEKRLLAHLERWPKDATTHNNLAWMYARCNVKLNEALEHSQLAVELSPHSAVLLDTLAEIQFRLNQYSAAIHSIRRCIQLDPRDPHMRRQLERFQKAEMESLR